MEGSTAAAPARRAVAARTMIEAFRLTAEDRADRVAVRTKDDELRLTWAELRERVDAFAGGLAKLGVRRGCRGRPADARRPARRPRRAAAGQPPGFLRRRPRDHDARRHAVLAVSDAVA